MKQAWYWISWATEYDFVGAMFLPATYFVGALLKAKVLDPTLHGQVTWVKMDDDPPDFLIERYGRRRLSREDCEKLDAAMEAWLQTLN